VKASSLPPVGHSHGSKINALIANSVDRRQNRGIARGGIGLMGDDGFESWLSMIGHLDGSQRRRALRALALSQAADGGTSDDASDRDGAGARPTPPDSAPDDSLLGKLGRDRIESFGCPHCSSAEVRRWGRASGKPRYRCAGCGKTFNPLTGTPLAGLHHQERCADQAQNAGQTRRRP